MRIHAVNKLIEQRLNNATKPFNARGSKVDRCVYCRVDKQYCICEFQPNIDSKVAVILLMSDSEVLKPSNTGRLIADVVKNTSVFQWNRTEPDRKLLEMLANTEYSPMVVFPEEYVDDKQRVIHQCQQAHSEQQDKTTLLIFIDSSWREARKIFRKSPYLHALPVLSFQPESVSQYLMRKAEKDNQLSTAEVATLALSSAGEHHAADVLQQWFTVFRESYLISKTRLKRDYTRPVLQSYRSEQDKLF
ncbi:tRNA-uridine aminocarboxypropyltransferase [Vibrio sp. 99-8-1]|uniref:tRNA-uridine aminocarboxypropyltransferase n=1 Tax=Vibrio sp. 99-8-1 TaxID=2607602 RepID=UPI0014939F19|nr:tRNA-uridine aminocarboxypropyltransferase [Vibrio sp. 99-8-1]NOI65471.1 DTW domain-containing protein [Vibrio sp. 99-8-1]